MAKTPIIQFIYVGRLVQEKGFHLVLQAYEHLMQTPLADHFCLHIFGDGVLKKDIPTSSNISYHGHQSKDIVYTTWKQCHYTLMPSQFLETFGLTALDSLVCGAPVIGPQKGGLKQFVSDKHALSYKSSDLLAVMKEHIISFDKAAWEQESKKTKEQASGYTQEMWIDRFRSLSGLEPGSTIFLVSDYIVDVGGIEHYLHNTKQLLEKAGYRVLLVGCDDASKASNRFAQLFGTIWNTNAKNMLAQAIHKHKPDLIWWHSIQRWLGPAPFRSIVDVDALQRVMYHDFGLFYPYPAFLTYEKDVLSTITFKKYMRTGASIKRRQTSLQLAKWWSSSILKALLAKHIDLHLVPSAYMSPLIAEHYEDPIAIEVLPHFIV